MIGEIYGSKDNHSPITACISLLLKSLRWKLVSILFDCTLQLWLTAHCKVSSGSGTGIVGTWPDLTKIQRTRKIPWRDAGFDCSSLEVGFAKILAKNAFFGKENGIRGRDDWSSQVRYHDPPSPPDPILYTTVRSGRDSKSITKSPDWEYLFLDRCSLISLASHLVS